MKGIKGHVIKFKLSDHETVKDFILAVSTSDGLLLQVPQQQSGYFHLGVNFD